MIRNIRILLSKEILNSVILVSESDCFIKKKTIVDLEKIVESQMSALEDL
jgi:hypothetical protein